MDFLRIFRSSALCLIVFSLSGAKADEPLELAPRLDLPVTEIRETFAPYASFCERHPSACDMSGPRLIVLNTVTMRLLMTANAEVNQAVDCTMNDYELFGFEEYWALPSEGLGDCEDIALFKRERLVELGLPRGALTIAIVRHRENMAPHAVLLAETTAGTYLLNMFTDDVVLWHEAPYNFEARERPDGSWERFDQSNWSYE